MSELGACGTRPWATTGTRNQRPSKPQIQLAMHPSFTGPGPRGSPPAQILESLVLMKASLMDSESLLKQPACNVRGPRVVLSAARKRVHRVLNAGCSILLRDGQQLADTPHHRSWTRAAPYSSASLMPPHPSVQAVIADLHPRLARLPSAELLRREHKRQLVRPLGLRFSKRVAATRRYTRARARVRAREMLGAVSALMSVALVVSAFGQSAVKQSILALMEQWEEAERSLSDDDVKLIVVL
jgi:hypothetical protein